MFAWGNEDAVAVTKIIAWGNKDAVGVTKIIAWDNEDAVGPDQGPPDAQQRPANRRRSCSTHQAAIGGRERILQAHRERIVYSA